MNQRHINARERAPEEIRAHYLAERELAAQLRLSGPKERGALYITVYDELFRRVPSHPLLRRKIDPVQRANSVRWQIQFLRRFIKPSHSFLEIGAGDCVLALEVAKIAAKVYAIDVSEKLAETAVKPENFELRISDGSSLDVRDESVDVAYSNQLLEHLHPDDAQRHLREVFRVLKPGGAYVCVTPNRLGGPYDISRHFDTLASGLHLKEYTVTDALELFRSIGFRRVQAYVGARGFFLNPGVTFMRMLEYCLGKLPHGFRQTWCDSTPMRPLMMLRVVGTKT